MNSVVPVAPVFFDYARRLGSALHEDLFRVRVDDSDDSFGKKIRNAATHKAPNIFVVGQKEQEADAVTWRRRGHEQHQPMLGFAAAQATLRELRARRLMDNFPDVDILEQIKSFRWYYDNQPLAYVKKIRLALRRWIANANGPNRR